MTSPVQYYSTHGPMTNPAPYATRLDELVGLPLAELCRSIRGLVVHYRSPELDSMHISSGRLDEVRSRTIPRMLARIISLDTRPLSIQRPPDRRILGCCRDFATLLCAVLRHAGVPARVRVGFADYLGPDLFVDHWVTEYWNGSSQRWTIVDAERNGGGGRETAFDPLDVPLDRFIPAGRAWGACRSGQRAPMEFGYDPAERGMWVIRANLLHDLACLNKTELTPWDFWGIGLTAFSDASDAELELLDRVATVTEYETETLEPIATIFEDRRLRVPPIVTSYTMEGDRIQNAIM